MCYSLFDFFCFFFFIGRTKGRLCVEFYRAKRHGGSHWSWTDWTSAEGNEQQHTNNRRRKTGKQIFPLSRFPKREKQKKEKKKVFVKDLMAAVSWWCHEEGGPFTGSLVTMAMVASTVLYSMSSMSGGGLVLGNTCEEGVWPPQASVPSPTSPRADGKAASSERGGAKPSSFSSFTSSKEADTASPLLPSCCSASSSSPVATSCDGSCSSPCTNASPASCSRDEDEENEEEDDEDASIFSSLGEESRFPEEAGVGSGEGGSCSVPGSIREDESRVSVSEVLVGVSASWWSDFDSPQDGRAEEEEVDATQSGAAASLALSSSLLTLRRFTGVAPSSSADTHTHTHIMKPLWDIFA